jgi:hypothetical protein
MEETTKNLISIKKRNYNKLIFFSIIIFNRSLDYNKL